MLNPLKTPVKTLVSKPLGAITSVHTNKPIAALTFDDGPHPSSTPQLLELLDTYNAKATFFMVGANALAHSGLVKDIKARGHALGNHTMTHPSVPTLSLAAFKQELNDCHKALQTPGTRLFRPPYGHMSIPARLELLRQGYRVVVWSGHCIDWLDHDSAWLQRRLEEKLSPGAIILLHDYLFMAENPAFANRQPMLRALERVLASQRYQFVTVPELLTYGAVKQKLWFKQGDAQWLASLKKPVLD